MLAACQRDKPPGGTAAPNAGSGSAGSGSSQVGSAQAGSQGGVDIGQGIVLGKGKDIDSKDILARTETSPEVYVKHVLIAWGELVTVYRDQLDPRAAKRTNDDAVKLAQDVAAQLKANPDKIDELAKQHSEDPGSLTGDPYEVTAAGKQFVPEFKNLAIRLKEKEVGIVRTKYGYHVMVRVPPPPVDPLESADILKRPEQQGDIEVQHVLIGWKDSAANPDPRAKARSKEDADKLAKEVLAKVKAGADMAKLMKQYSEDPASKDTGRAYEVSANAPLVEPFKKLSLRLQVNEAGLVKTPFGWHVIKRVAPDKLNSSDILARTDVAKQVKVKHVLLGWTGAHTDDKRGEKRTRAELEKLVQDTVAKLKKGEPIEPMMKALSEDPGSAASGEAYDVSEDAGMVPPFTNLALRLQPGEVGVVKTQFGIHIIQRVDGMPEKKAP